jgi:uncharacterized coiled-coil DUF342 family protein
VEDIESVRDDVKVIQREHGEARRRCDEIQKALYTLVEAQKNTTKNVDRLADDVKALIKNASEYHVLEVGIENINKKVEELESSKQWGFRLIIGAVITAVIGLLYDFRGHL